MPRCFGDGDAALASYHDTEWGQPTSNPTAVRRGTRSGLHEDELYEALACSLFLAETPLASLLHERALLRGAFARWEPKEVQKLGPGQVAAAFAASEMRLNPTAIETTIANAHAFSAVADEFGSEAFGGFDQYSWQFTHYNTLGVPSGLPREATPTESPESSAMCQDLRQRGFRGISPTSCYAFMQMVGMVNDHAQGCPLAPTAAVVGIVQLTPLLFLTTTGRKSGRPRTRPLPYQRLGEAYSLTGSNAGREYHPAWYLNLRDHPEATIKVDDVSMRVRSRAATPEERAGLWAQKVAKGTSSVGFQTMTKRVFPVVILERIE